MSYLDYPRLHFSGGFIADPSTINNTPNNYDSRLDEIKELELYWNPNGTGIFDLQNCVVTKVVYGPGEETTDPTVDPIIGKSVTAVYSKAAPKMVDLDPDQQNVSEIWGLSLQVAGLGPNPSSIQNFVRGDYIEGPFNAIWLQSLKGPRSSASGSGVYQSTLTDLAWDTSATPASPFLTALNTASADALSVNFVVNSHNNSPPLYSFNDTTFTALAAAPYNIPSAILTKLDPMKHYIQNIGLGDNRGDVPTESYVNHQLNMLLGQQDANTYGAQILAGTKAPYNPGDIATTFPTGLITGTIGPQISTAPTYYTPSRTMAPLTNSKCYFAPFNAIASGSNTLVTLNLGNSLVTNSPGYDIAYDMTGTLTVVYFDQTISEGISLSNAVPFANLPTDFATTLEDSAGIIELTVDANLLPANVTAAQANTAILSSPLGLVGALSELAETEGTSAANWASATAIAIYLAENVKGFNVRADRFVYRMNPGISTSADQPQGDTAVVNFYVTKFGHPAEGIELNTCKLDEDAAIAYTQGTLGTGGTRGIKKLSTPIDALCISETIVTPPFSKESEIIDTPTITTDSNGIAQLYLAADDPGTPRACQDIDGQIYFIKYSFADTAIGTYTQDANDLVSVQVYSKIDIPETPTWTNCISKILPQYDKLYPIMGRFDLASYDIVVENAAAIHTVLSLPMADALRMPVIRDLSIARTNAVLTWINNGTPM